MEGKMQFAKIASVVGEVPFISKGNAKLLYDLIREEKLTRILELGIAHGTATCYMAAALEELGEGLITSVDLIDAKNIFEPSAEAQLSATGLLKFAKIVRMTTGYTWFLHDEIRRNTRDHNCSEVYDLCIIDGPKNWTIDGAAFFFVDKLLKKDGWIIFDDYNWTYADADNRRDSTDGITHRNLSENERNIPHIKEVFELLVKQHPNYSDFSLLARSDWALAKKVVSDTKTNRIIDIYESKYNNLIVRAVTKVRRHLEKAVRRVRGKDQALIGSNRSY
jgi:predicted O-methyltransferase YrrM